MTPKMTGNTELAYEKMGTATPNIVSGASPVPIAFTIVGYISEPATHKARDRFTLNLSAVETASKNGRK